MAFLIDWGLPFPLAYFRLALKATMGTQAELLEAILKNEWNVFWLHWVATGFALPHMHDIRHAFDSIASAVLAPHTKARAMHQAHDVLSNEQLSHIYVLPCNRTGQCVIR